jgi:hypothetical protein
VSTTATKLREPGDRPVDERPVPPRWLRVLLPATLLFAWLAIGSVSGPYQGKLAEVQRNDFASYLPASAEATETTELQKWFNDLGSLPAIIVYERTSGITEADLAAVQNRATALTWWPGVQPGGTPPIPTTKDDQALQLIVPLKSDDPEQGAKALTELREVVRQDLPEGLDVYMTGPAGQIADLSETFAAVDGLLLGVTASVPGGVRGAAGHARGAVTAGTGADCGHRSAGVVAIQAGRLNRSDAIGSSHAAMAEHPGTQAGGYAATTAAVRHGQPPVAPDRAGAHGRVVRLRHHALRRHPPWTRRDLPRV